MLLRDVFDVRGREPVMRGQSTASGHTVILDAMDSMAVLRDRDSFRGAGTIITARARTF